MYGACKYDASYISKLLKRCREKTESIAEKIDQKRLHNKPSQIYALCEIIYVLALERVRSNKTYANRT